MRAPGVKCTAQRATRHDRHREYRFAWRAGASGPARMAAGTRLAHVRLLTGGEAMPPPPRSIAKETILTQHPQASHLRSSPSPCKGAAPIFA